MELINNYIYLYIYYYNLPLNKISHNVGNSDVKRNDSCDVHNMLKRVMQHLLLTSVYSHIHPDGKLISCIQSIFHQYNPQLYKKFFLRQLLLHQYSIHTSIIETLYLDHQKYHSLFYLLKHKI